MRRVARVRREADRRADLRFHEPLATRRFSSAALARK